MEQTHIDIAMETTAQAAKTAAETAVTQAETASSKATSADDKLGDPSDAAGTGSVFAHLNRIYTHLTTYLSSTISGYIGTINTNVGTSSATASSSGTSLFALIKYVVARFTGYWTDTRASKLDNLDATVSTRATQASVGTSSDTASSSGVTLFALLKYVVSILLSGGIPIVKSVQRGVSSASEYSATVTISAVNTSKSLVIAFGSGYSYFSSTYSARHPYAYLTSSTVLTVGGGTGSASSSHAVRWQVVEFY